MVIILGDLIELWKGLVLAIVVIEMKSIFGINLPNISLTLRNFSVNYAQIFV